VRLVPEQIAGCAGIAGQISGKGHSEWLVLIGEHFDASQEGLFPEDDQFKHQDRNEGRQAAKTGRGYRAKESWQEQKVKTIEVI
jgi:hypothetical protein